MQLTLALLLQHHHFKCIATDRYINTFVKCQVIDLISIRVASSKFGDQNSKDLCEKSFT